MEGIAIHTRNQADQIALRGVRVRSQLVALGQLTTVEQTFVNLEDRAVEAVYTFPLPAHAAVRHFEVITGDRVLTGRVEERSKAEDLYDEAISDGHGAFLFEQHRPDVFTVNVGNIKPKQAVTIRIEYVAELEVTDSSIRLAFPTTVAPRYVTATGQDPLQAVIEGDQVNPPHVLHVPYGLSFETDVRLGLPVRSIECTSHQAQVDLREDGTGIVRLAEGVIVMDRDIVLNIALGKEPKPRALAGQGPNSETFVAVTIQPEFEEGPTTAEPQEIVFVLDCSGSMDGDSLIQAKKALELCLRSLSEGDAFNICRFGSTYEFMSPEPLTYSAASLERAVKYVRRIGADLGGTEIHSPLEAVLRSPTVYPRPRQIVLLTDGQVSNENAIIDLARRHRHQNRIFTFGIGFAASAHLVHRVANAAGGAAEFVSEGERIEDKVLRTFSRLASPMAESVEIDWGPAEVQNATPNLPAVFEGDSLVVRGRVVGAMPTSCTVRVKTQKETAEWQVEIPTPAPENSLLATLWARQRIEYLEAGDVSPETSARNRRRDQKQLVKLSKDFGLLCSETSFVAIEHRSLEDRNEGRPEFRRVPVQLACGWRVPVQLACGWHGIGHECRAPHPVEYASDASDVYMEFAPVARPGFRAIRQRKAFEWNRNRPASRDVLHVPLAEDEARSAAVNPLCDLLALQQAEGWFRFPKRRSAYVMRLNLLWKDLLGIVEKVMPSPIANLPKTARVQITNTVVALCILHAVFASQQPLWRRAAKKSVHYLANTLSVTKEQVMEWIRTINRELETVKKADNA